MVAPVGADLEHAFPFEEAVVAQERHAAAELAGARLVGDELVGQELDRLFGLGDLDRVRGHVGEHVRVAVEAVGERPCAPGAAGEIDIDEGLAVGVIAADRDAGVAAVAGGFHPVGQHHGERAEHAVDHAEAGEATRGAGCRQNRVAHGARRADHLNGAEHAFVVGDARR